MIHGFKVLAKYIIFFCHLVNILFALDDKIWEGKIPVSEMSNKAKALSTDWDANSILRYPGFYADV